MRMFPSNSLPLKQELWMDRLNLLPEESHRLLEGFREGLNRNPPVKSFWCDRHFEGKPDPIDRRTPTTPNPADTPNTAVTALPQITRQLSEVRVNDRSSIASSHHSNAQSASFPSPFRGNSASFPSPLRIISETSNGDNLVSSQQSDKTVRTEELCSSQETVTMDEEEAFVVPSALPQFLLVSSSQLLKLFDRCPSCGLKTIESMTSFINGSALKLKWTCEFCTGEQSWSSQTRLKGRYYEGNVKLACAAHTTGLPLPRFRDCADLLGLGIPSERTFHDLLVRLILPATDSIYSNHLQLVQTTVWNTMNTHLQASRGVDVSVDGRYDSPGYSASNCTVSCIDLQTNLLFMVVNMHKKEKGIDNVSGRMEKVGVRTGLRSIQALQIKNRSLCSDNDSKIGKMMREDPQLRDIKHLLDFWHLIKGINHDLRKISKLACCSNIKHWRRQIVNHAYYVHSKFGKSRQRGLMYWMSVLPHVTGRHANFRKVPFLSGIKKCMHSRLRPSNSHIIKRDSVEYQELKAIIMKPTFLAGFLRASPRKNTSPNENFNSIINISRRWYGERIKLATMHFNTLALLNLLNLRKEKGSSSVNAIGRESKAVKRKMGKADHEWRREVWEAIPEVIEGRLLELFMRKHNVPNDRAYLQAMQDEEEDVGSNDEEAEEGGEGKEGGESDVSEKLGGGVYGEEVDSDLDPVMKAIDLSDVEDEESEEEDSVAGEGEEPSSGSEWDEGMAGEMALERGGRGRGRGKVRGGRGRGAHGRRDTVTQLVVAASQKSSVLTNDTSYQEDDEKRKEKGDGRKKERRTKNSKENSSSDSDWDEPPVKKGRGKGKCRIVDNKGE
ncbi:hypothetical protein PRIPAC_77683 [Pristionchus pacificus]|uniref:Mutator-like transposase domain-containing protein n=1 Tax=Pristionchus pacificus TaxID=54126 RepID=A0A2A6BI16_PRIPA|nr:hypothetical protein PRIPAC_77683 [Pristionchus pacificus]|eukprot:PDM65451.1 hypothetical protein PRIPAC_52393 [Pristionchus pacificus]